MNEYFYKLPKELIAQEPIEPRDASRLFVYDTKSNEIAFDIFCNCAKYIPSESTLILNKTKVVPARAYLRKETGGRVEVLFLVNEYKGGDEVLCIVDRRIDVGKKLYFSNNVGFEIIEQKEQFFLLRFLFDKNIFFQLLEEFGTMPIPKYIHNPTFSEVVLRDRYQSIFAKSPASIAAPTASLHFTESVFHSFHKKNINTLPITLHVGMGTFAPVTSEQIKNRNLHSEWYSIPEDVASTLGNATSFIIPVGTTAMRALESFGRTGKLNGNTELFIKKPFSFVFASGLITNFHVPESSLMYLVDALLEHKHAKRSILDLYEIAIREKFRFFSFGDAMLIL